MTHNFDEQPNKKYENSQKNPQEFREKKPKDFHQDLLGLKQFTASTPIVIPSYKIIDICGRGGMGTVYKAWDEKLKREVAVKLISKTAISNQNAQRFIREVQVTSQLVHPNIVRLYQTGQTADYVFFAMQYVDGTDLSTYVKKNNLSSRRIAQLFIQMLDALVYAHQNKVVHRDLKPGNILVDKSGTVFIMDFGLAKVMGEDHSLTTTGQILGTPHYMSPEQIDRPKEINLSSDIFSLGVILYQLLTKELPFTGNREIQVFHNIMNETPIPPRKLNSKIPVKLELICLQAMQKKPESRYNASQMRSDLQFFFTGKNISVSRTKLILSNKKAQSIFKAFLCLIIVLSSVSYFFFPKTTKSHLDIFEEKSYNKLTLPQKINYIDNLISYGAYEDAWQYINQILLVKIPASTRQEVLQKAIVILVKIKKFDLAINIFSSIKNQNNPQVLLAISQAYLAQQDLQQAQHFIHRTTKITPEYLSINGHIAFHQKKYLKSKEHFRALLDKFPQSPLVKDTQFFYAQSLFFSDSQKHFSQIITLLKKLEKDFSQKILIYEFLGRTYLKNATPKNLVYAEDYFKRSLELSPHNSHYFVYLAQTQIQLKKLGKAFENIRVALEKKADNKDALKAMLQLTLQDATLISDCFNFLKFYADKGFALQITTPNLFTKELTSIRDSYATAYSEWKFYTTRNNNTNFNVYFSVLNNPDSHKRVYKDSLLGLRNARYSNNWKQAFSSFLKTKLSSKVRSRLLQIKRSIEQQKKREHSQALYYLMASLSLETKSEVLQELEIYSPQIQSILSSKEQNIFIRYLAAHTLGKLRAFETLEAMKNNKISVVRDLAYIVLSTNKFSLNEDTILEIITRTKIPIIKCMAIHSLFYQSQISNQVKQRLRSLLTSSNLQIRLYAAAALSNEDKAIVLLKAATSSSEDYKRYFAHYYLWKNISNSFMSENTQLFEKIIRDSNTQIRAIILHYLQNYQPKKNSWVWKCFNEFPETILVCKAFSIAIAKNPSSGMVVGFFAKGKGQKQVRNSIVKAYTYMELLQSLTKQYVTKSSQEGLKTMSATRRLLKAVVIAVPLIPNQKDVYFKTMAYYLSAIFDCRALRNLPQEKDNDIKAHILYGLCMETIGQKMPDSVPKEMEKILKAAWDNLLRRNGYYNREEVEEIINSYINNPHQNLRQSAYISKIVFCHDKRESLYNEGINSKDNFIKKIIAKGFHSLIQIKVRNHIPLLERGSRKSLEQHYWYYLDILKELASTDSIKLEYIDHLNKAISLDKSRAEYYFERGYLYRLLKKYKKAREDWTKAIKISPKNVIYRYFLAKNLYHQKNDAKNKNLQASDLLKDVSPESDKTILNIASLNFKLKRYKATQDMLKKIIRNSNLHMKYHILFILTYLRQNNKSYAQIYLQYIRKKYPNHKQLTDKNLSKYSALKSILQQQ
ncbi:protein kinase [Candidatus Uabimicrobium sp. HlEnr_7]|uniref:protein kinase domain-containing protein n=1 Tax=Candidatus Uabimicrobium helgolandensis TaxID=3095367 RepID=UPI003556EB2F